MNDTNVKIVVLGGGTGSFMLLDELKHHTSNLTAIVNMVDDGGSTGVLRDELGVLPPGDVRQCLVALSRSPDMRDLFNYRFEEGTFRGHSFGNMFLTALEKTTGSFADAVQTASDILRTSGRVLPATLDNVRLVMTWPDGAELRGEKVIDAEHFSQNPREARLSLDPKGQANPHALEAIAEADLIVVAPGDLYTSIGPLLAVDGIVDAVKASSAKKLYVCNLVTKEGQTDDLAASGHAAEIERLAGEEFLDYMIYNDAIPDVGLAERYKAEGSYVVEADQAQLKEAHYIPYGGDLLGGIDAKETSDVLPVTRSLIRHDGAAVAKLILDVYHKNR
ncbi:MAG TPA: gluconeogenesis factor YvcK family protein [Candidatus Saccharimonadales bacterium]